MEGTGRYEILPHTADIGVASQGATLAEIIANTAYAMFDLMFDLAEIEPQASIEVVVTAQTPPELLVDCLSDLLAASEIRDLVLGRFHVEIEGTTAKIAARGATTSTVAVTGPPIKAVTYHDLQCAWTGTEWRSRVIFDV